MVAKNASRPQFRKSNDKKKNTRKKPIRSKPLLQSEPFCQDNSVLSAVVDLDIRLSAERP